MIQSNIVQERLWDIIYFFQKRPKFTVFTIVIFFAWYCSTFSLWPCVPPQGLGLYLFFENFEMILEWREEAVDFYHDVFKLMQANGIKVWLSYSSLLQARRGGKLFWWDWNDAEFDIPPTQIEAFAALNKTFLDNGFIIIASKKVPNSFCVYPLAYFYLDNESWSFTKWFRINIAYFARKPLHIGMFACYIFLIRLLDVESTQNENDSFAEGATGWGHKEKMKFDGHLDPLVEATLENRKFLIPHDADYILGVSYGHDWRTEKLPSRVIFCTKMLRGLFLPLLLIWLIVLAIVRGDTASSFLSFLCNFCQRAQRNKI